MRCAPAAVVALLLAVPAAADIGIRGVAPTTVRPGVLVSITVSGYLGRRRPAMPIVLIPAQLMPRPTKCKRGICEPIVWRRRLNRAPYRVVGRIANWRTDPSSPDHATGLLRFRLPRLAAGRYEVALWCAPCVRGRQGSLIAGPELRIR